MMWYRKFTRVLDRLLHPLNPKVPYFIPDDKEFCRDCNGFGYSEETRAIIKKKGGASGTEITFCSECGGKGYKDA